MSKWRSKKEVPLDVIERGLKDPDWRVRQAAMNACQGREVPLDVIERWLKDPDWRVRQAAVNIAKERGVEIPVYRSFEPPEKVYKKCEGGAIVVASLPKDAEVRGTPDGKCRASKAVILEVIGGFCGEPAGISLHDGTVWYYAGDEVEIEDFDLSDKECSAGYHFFCTKEQAEAYGN